MMKSSKTLIGLTALVSSGVACGADSDALAKQAADPTSSLMSFNFCYLATPSYYGGGDTSHILRTTISYDMEGPAGSGLAEVTIFDLLTFDRPWGRFGVGPVVQMIPERNGRDGQFAIGPAAGIVVSKGKWTYGLFNQNLFGDDILISSLQPVLAYQLGKGWALSSGDAQWTMDWDRGEVVNLPIGLQLSKVSSIDGQAVKWSLNPECNARAIDGAPQ